MRDWKCHFEVICEGFCRNLAGDRYVFRGATDIFGANAPGDWGGGGAQRMSHPSGMEDGSCSYGIISESD